MEKITQKKYFITTYGCQMNVHESEKIAGALRELDYISAKSYEDADIIVFNTCCVRENAENHAVGNIGMLKKLKKQNPNLIIAVCGCMTQQVKSAEKINAMFPFVDIILGTFNIDNFKRLVLQKLNGKKKVFEILDKNGEVNENVTSFRTSYPNAWVNIMYGCNNFCSYCIVPYVRGRERSRKKEDILKEVSELIEMGYKEITLLGQNVNSYGKDLYSDYDFSDLLNEVCKIEGKYRVRFMSNHPKDFTEKLALTIKSNDKICNQLHLPVQSGSNRVLELMNRRYTREKYLSEIEMLKNIIPNVAITTDIIVGFPTETDQDFLDTVNLVETVRYSGAFTFVYSKRDGTKASVMDGQVDEDVKKQRIMKLVDIQNEINREQSKTYIGKTIEVLCEDFDQKKNQYMGRDEYGRMAYFSYHENIIGRFVEVSVEANGGMSLIGTVKSVEELN